MSPITPLEYARKNQLSYEAARTRLNELAESGAMAKTRLPNGRVYYVSTAPDIKAHDPFNLAKKDSPESYT